MIRVLYRVRLDVIDSMLCSPAAVSKVFIEREPCVVDSPCWDLPGGCAALPALTLRLPLRSALLLSPREALLRSPPFASSPSLSNRSLPSLSLLCWKKMATSGGFSEFAVMSASATGTCHWLRL